MDIDTCLGSLRIPRELVELIEEVMSSIVENIDRWSEAIYFLRGIGLPIAPKIEIEVVSSTLYLDLNLLLYLVRYSSALDGISNARGYGYAIYRSKMANIIASLTKIYKIVSKGCIALYTDFGWIANCSDEEPMQAIKRIVQERSLVKLIDAESRWYKMLFNVTAVEDLLKVILKYPLLALSIASIYPLYLPLDKIDTKAARCKKGLAIANLEKNEIVVDPYVLCCMDMDRAEMLIRIAIHEYLHLLTYANTGLSYGTWVLETPIGLEHAIDELSRELTKKLLPFIGKAIEEKLQSVDLHICKEHTCRENRVEVHDLGVKLLSKQLRRIYLA